MFDSNEVLLDPSILVADDPETELVGQRTLDQFTEGDDGVSLHVPAAFVDVVADCDAYNEDSTFELFLGDISSGITDFDDLQTLLDRDAIRQFSAADRRGEPPYRLVYDHLTDEHPPQTKGSLADVLFDEFVFLFERSWVASRLKKPLDKLLQVDEGIRTLRVENRAVSHLVDSSDDYVTDRLRRLDEQPGWDWGALGGPASDLLAPDDEFVDALTNVGQVPDSLALLFEL
jgi:hypothetical protein